MKKLFILLLFCFLTGCLGNAHFFPAKYQEPTQGPYAHIRFLDKRYSNNSPIEIYSNTMCMNHKFYKGYLAFYSIYDRFKSRSLGMPHVQPTASAYGEFKVKANEPMVVEYFYSHEEPFGRGTMTTRCHSAVTFSPQAGRNYEASFDVNNGFCKTTIEEIIKQDGVYKYAPVLVMPTGVCKSRGL